MKNVPEKNIFAINNFFSRDLHIINNNRSIGIYHGFVPNYHGKYKFISKEIAVHVECSPNI